MGTADFTIMDIGDGAFEVIATDGNAFLGGDDFSLKIVNWLINEFKSETGIDVSNDKMATQRLMDAAENAKKELSTTLETEINLPFLTADATGPKHLVKKLSKAKFESLIEKEIKEIEEHIHKVIELSKLKISDINEIVMVGGSIRIPKIQEITKKIFNKDLNMSVNPDEVVSIGATLQGAVLKGDVKDVLLLDVTPLSLGIETAGNVFTKLIERNTTIPVKKSEVFSTYQDNQPAVSIVLGQGEREFMKDNKILGTFNLDGIPLMPRGTPQIEVTVDIDANGIITVSAKEKSTGKENKISITGSSNLSEQEIKTMINEAEKHKEQDKKQKEIVEEKNKLDQLISEAEKHNIDCSKFKDIKERENIDELRAGVTELMQKIQTQSQTQNNCSNNNFDTNNKKQKEDDVIDAEVE